MLLSLVCVLLLPGIQGACNLRDALYSTGVNQNRQLVSSGGVYAWFQVTRSPWQSIAPLLYPEWFAVVRGDWNQANWIGASEEEYFTNDESGHRYRHMPFDLTGCQLDKLWCTVSINADDNVDTLTLNGVTIPVRAVSNVLQPVLVNLTAFRVSDNQLRMSVSNSNGGSTGMRLVVQQCNVADCQFASCTSCTASTCLSCTAGYLPSGLGCVDFNECLSAADNQCDAHATCSNTPGSYTCACKDGYRSSNGSNNGRFCEEEGNPIVGYVVVGIVFGLLVVGSGCFYYRKCMCPMCCAEERHQPNPNYSSMSSASSPATSPPQPASGNRTWAGDSTSPTNDKRVQSDMPLPPPYAPAPETELVRIQLHNSPPSEGLKPALDAAGHRIFPPTEPSRPSVINLIPVQGSKG